MTREELKKHCEKQIEMCEMWAISKGEKPSGKIYEEHNLILELLEQETVLDKIRAEIMELDVFYDNDYFSGNKEAMLKRNEVLRIIYKYKALDQERDCEHCVHQTDKGCSSWDCEFERRTE